MENGYTEFLGLFGRNEINFRKDLLIFDKCLPCFIFCVCIWNPKVSISLNYQSGSVSQEESVKLKTNYCPQKETVFLDFGDECM